MDIAIMTGNSVLKQLKRSFCNNGIGFVIKVVNSTIKLKSFKT